MTHNDIYKKYLIDYDKANVTSSYPSLTKYEIATILNKAYLALIAQKFTGNNPRRAPFESDAKAIADLQPLIAKSLIRDKNPRPYREIYGDSESEDDENTISNVFSCDLPSDMLYYVSSIVRITDDALQKKRVLNIKLVDHETAKKFFTTSTNIPWVKTPVAYIEGGKIYIVYDEYLFYGTNDRGLSVDVANEKHGTAVTLTYIKLPNKFKESTFVDGDEDVEFELSDQMAEELINLAVAMSAEIVESNRLSTKLNTRSLES